MSRFDFDWGISFSKKPTIYYLAYGSNLSLERMEERCPYAEVVGTTFIPGYRLLFKKSGSGFYATIEQDANCEVPVAVYRISEYDEALLDRYEGCPRYYYKREFFLPIHRLGGRWSWKKHLCMAYILHEDRLLGEPTMEYFDLLNQGYEDWGFVTSALRKGLASSIGQQQAGQFLNAYERWKSEQE